jgi:CheY-like chemotaxis protein
MRDGGIITVKCQNQVIDEQDTLPLPSGKYVRISIQDQGCGIPEENLGKIFDPYFTTKDMGRGLGLTAVHSIMKKHEGYITVESTPGSGTTVSLLIPAAASPLAASKAEAESGLVAGGGKILVMDDDALVLQVVKAMLERLGYEAALAVNGEDAITRYVEARQAGKPFDVVIMDLIVPGGMGGEELMQELLAIDPQVKAIVSSGYCYDPVMADYKSYGFKGVIAKPYLFKGLTQQLQQILRD